MRQIHVMTLALIATLLLGTGCATQSRPRPVAWDLLPFPGNSDWGGPKGEPATMSGGDLILRGQRVRTTRSYFAPLTVDCQVELEGRRASDGSFDVEFVPVGSPLNISSANGRVFRMIYRNPGAYSGKDALVFVARDAGSPDKTVWGEQAFIVRARKPYAIRIEISTTQVHLVIDGQAYDLKGVRIPYGRFYVQLGGWQPTNRWHVRDFSIH